MELRPAIGDVIVNNFGVEIGLVVEVIDPDDKPPWRVIADHGHQVNIVTTGKPGVWKVGP